MLVLPPSTAIIMPWDFYRAPDPSHSILKIFTAPAASARGLWLRKASYFCIAHQKSVMDPHGLCSVGIGFFHLG